MSHGGDVIAQRGDSATQPRAGHALRELIYAGRSFSGRERNCCYLNTRGRPFANISALSGWDLPDDARALALVDWDFDGDLDLWVVNRSGPQLRYLENGYEGHNRALRLQLIGHVSNRDAIGARVRVDLANGEPPLVRTVRAGTGYLAQSSRELHFGLGSTARITGITIQWPAGGHQPIGPLPAGRFVIEEGSAPAPIDAPSPLAARPPSTEPMYEARGIPAVDSSSRTVLTTPIPLPPLPLQSHDGKSTSVQEQESGSEWILVSLWSQHCIPCVRELHEFNRRYSELQAANVSVLALSVDEIFDRTYRDDLAWFQQQAFTFAGGRATPELADFLQTVHDGRFDLHRALPVPCSFLIVRSRSELAAIYKGRVDVQQLLRDVALPRNDAAARRTAALPFAGRWSASVRPPRLLTEALAYLALVPTTGRPASDGTTGEMTHAPASDMTLQLAAQYAQANRANLERDAEHHVLLYTLGQHYSRLGRHAEARDMYKSALADAPQLVPAWYNLGTTLAMLGELGEASRAFGRAAELAPSDHDAHLQWGRTLLRAGQVESAGEPLATARKLAPQDAATMFESALQAALIGATREGIGYWRRAAELDRAQFESRRAREQMTAAARLGIERRQRAGEDVRAALRLIQEIAP